MIVANTKRILYFLAIIVAVVFTFPSETVAAPETNTLKTASLQRPAVRLEKIRFYSYGAEKTRIVCDLSNSTDYTVTLQDNPPRLIIDLQSTEIKGVPPIIPLTDTLATQITTVPGQDRRVMIEIGLAYMPQYKVFKLAAPSRLVIDLYKTFEQKTDRNLADGLRYFTVHRNTTDGFLAIHVLDFDLLSTTLKPNHILAKDAIEGLETVSSMAARTNAVAAVNGTYFTKTGELLGLVIHDDRIIQSPVPNRTAFAVKNSGETIIDEVNFNGEIEGPDGIICNIKAINRERGADEAVVYNSAYGKTTRTNQFGKEYTVIDGIVTQIEYGNSVIPASGYVVSSHGVGMKQLAQVKVGDPLDIRQRLEPEWTDVRFALGAGPLLIKNGNVFLTTKSEGFGGDVGGGRAPRTALGITPNQHLLLVVVDGRQPGYSDGMTLVELAKLMRDLGTKEAMNLDGGGSTELVIAGQVVNRPSDGKERLIGDALVFVPVQQKDEVVPVSSGAVPVNR